MTRKEIIDCTISPEDPLLRLNNSLTRGRKLVAKLVMSINRMTMENKITPNYIVCGNLVCAELMDNQSFYPSQSFDKEIRCVGRLLNYDVYVDYHLDNYTILVKYDKATERHFKLEGLLDDKNTLDTIEIKVQGL